MDLKYELFEKNEILEKSNFGEIASSVIEIKKSKFYSYIFKISNEDDISNILKIFRSKFSDARHIVYLYKLNDKLKYDEDSEPQGTTTKLLLDFINKQNVTNFLVITVRYFGGVLLGSGLLSRTYFNVFLNAYKKLDKQVCIEYVNYSTNISYMKYEQIKSNIEELINNRQLILESISFNELIKLDMKVNKEAYNSIINLFEL